jgi:hypothetical protein
MGKCRQIHRAAGLSSWPRHSEPGWMDSIDVAGRPIRWCATCGKRLALGPSNDEPAEVQVEIRAAELAAIPDDWRIGAMNLDEFHGYRHFTVTGAGDCPCSTNPGLLARNWQSGYLARAIAMHTDPLTLDEVKSALAVGAEERKAAERYRRAR